jgi:hypothetical protein
MNKNGPGILPVQKLPLREKGKDWRESSVDAIVGKEGTGRIGRYTRKEHMHIAYELYNGNFDKKDLKYITDPFDVGDSFPASPQEFNIIRPKVDLLVGEESKRPENFLVVQTNDEAVTMLQEKKKELLISYMMDLVSGSEDQEDPAMTPPQIQEYMQKNYKTIAEQQATQSIRYLREKLNLRNEFLRGWKDGLIAGEEIYYVGISNGEPVLNRENPLDCDYDPDPNLESIEDGDWFVKHTMMSPSEIYDVYYDKLEEKDLDELLAMSKGSGGSKAMGDDNYRPIIYKENITEHFKTTNSYTDDKLDLWHVVWRSYQRIGFVTYIDENGEEIEAMVDENYKPDPDEKVDWQWVGQVWEGYRVGSDLYFGIEPVDYIDAPLDSPERQKLPYIGVIYSNTNSRNKSLVNIMKPLQYMYIVVWYRLELMLARDKGRVLTMDVTQIPKSMGIDLPQWMHYLSALGVNLVNPYDEGWNIPGREGGKPAQFNQMSSQDLSMMNVIEGYIGILMKIEDMIGELSGVSKQRQGAIQQRELVGNVERAVIQSSHITEPLFWKHNLAKKNAIKMLLNTAKHAWKNSQGKKLHFIFDDMSRVFMDISEDFLYSDLDIFLSDSTKEDQNLQALKSLLQPAMQAGAGLFDVAEVLTSDSMSEIKDKLKAIEAQRQQMVQQQQEMEQQAAMQQAQMEAQQKAEENRIKEEDSIRQSETDIQVALIKAEVDRVKAAMTAGDGEEGDDGVEQEKLNIQKDKERHDYEIKRRQIEEAVRKNRMAEKQKAEEISIKRKQANKPVATKSK